MGWGRDVLEVARFSTLPEGELAVALLNRHGVAARLADRDMATMNPDLLIAIGGVRVVAPGNQLIKAREIIARVRNGEFTEADDDDGEWRLDAIPGRVGELEEHEISGALGWSKKAGATVLVLAFVVFPLSGCLVMILGR